MRFKSKDGMAYKLDQIKVMDNMIWYDMMWCDMVWYDDKWIVPGQTALTQMPLPPNSLAKAFVIPITPPVSIQSVEVIKVSSDH